MSKSLTYKPEPVNPVSFYSHVNIQFSSSLCRSDAFYSKRAYFYPLTTKWKPRERALVLLRSFSGPSQVLQELLQHGSFPGSVVLIDRR